MLIYVLENWRSIPIMNNQIKQIIGVFMVYIMAWL